MKYLHLSTHFVKIDSFSQKKQKKKAVCFRADRLPHTRFTRLR